MDTGLTKMIQLLQELHAGIAGVQWSPMDVAEYPVGQVPRNELPAVFSFPEDARWTKHAMGTLARQGRVFRIIVLVAEKSQGVMSEALADTVSLLQRFGDAYTNDDNQLLQGTPSEIALDTSDGGITDSGYNGNLLFNDSVYHGFEFLVSMHEKK